MFGMENKIIKIPLVDHEGSKIVFQTFDLRPKSGIYINQTGWIITGRNTLKNFFMNLVNS